MCDEAALKFIPDWFVTTGMIKKLFSASYTDEILLYFNKDFGDATFNYKKMGIVNINLNNINLDMILIKILVLLFFSKFLLGIENLENENYLRKN